MSLEDAILVLAEAVQELAIALGGSTPPSASTPEPIEVPDPAQTSIEDFSKTIDPLTRSILVRYPTLTEGWPTGAEHGNFGKKKRCSICGKEGYNKRTHPWHTLPDFEEMKARGD